MINGSFDYQISALALVQVGQPSITGLSRCVDIAAVAALRSSHVRPCRYLSLHHFFGFLVLVLNHLEARLILGEELEVR